MADRDRYDKEILKALQGIQRALMGIERDLHNVVIFRTEEERESWDEPNDDEQEKTKPSPNGLHTI